MGVGGKSNGVRSRQVSQSRRSGEIRNDRQRRKGPFSVLRIERLELRVLHSPQPLQAFDHLRMVFVLDPPSGGLVDGPTSVQFHRRSDVLQPGPGRGLSTLPRPGQTLHSLSSNLRSRPSWTPTPRPSRREAASPFVGILARIEDGVHG